LFYYFVLLFLHSHHYWSISSREIIEERNGMEEGREGITIIRKQYSTTSVEMKGTPVRRVLVVGRQVANHSVKSKK
jgi:hypothetical protein